MYTSAVVQLYGTPIIYDIHFYWDNEYWVAVTTPTSYKQGRQIELECLNLIKMCEYFSFSRNQSEMEGRMYKMYTP